MAVREAMQVCPEDAAGGLWPYAHGGAQLKRGTPPGQREQTSPLMLGDRPLLHDVSSVHDETSSSGNKDDEDEDDEESDDKVDLHKYDPERLKAFNMFVRLFVDENLDRIVPISKQPKEKIQAIIDSCTRQFPEFAERARKRIRTYLKSCRRNKRSRDGNGAWDTARPTPAHLTSVQAEQILAQACENESHNAKRMRLGLEPVSQPMPLIPGTVATESVPRPVMLEHFTAQTTLSSGLVAGVPTTCTLSTLPLSSNPAVTSSSILTNTSPSLGTGATVTVTPHNDWDRDHDVKPLVNNNHVIKNDGSINNFTSTPIKKEVVPSVEIIPTQIKAAPAVTTPVNCVSNNSCSPVPSMNGSVPPAAPTTVYRPNFSQAFQRTGDLRAAAPPPQPVNNLQSPPFNNNDTAPVSNGPTDLSMKSNPTKPLLSHKLNSTEIIAVRQLITGYRESAAFLLRSADELEQLLLSQH